jgi:hypothetical protein
VSLEFYNELWIIELYYAISFSLGAPIVSYSSLGSSVGFSPRLEPRLSPFSRFGFFGGAMNSIVDPGDEES